MFEGNQKQYILVTSRGETLNLFYNNRLGICLSVLNRLNKWTTPQVIIKNSLPYFRACIDTHDNIHLLHQDSRGDIIYLVHKGSGWNRFPILTAKSPLDYDKNLYMVLARGRIYIFYTIVYDGKNLLTMQEIAENGAPEKPSVLDYIDMSRGSYCCFYDEEAIYLAYDRITGNETKPGFRIIYYVDDNSVFTSISEKADIHIDAVVKDDSSELYLFCRKKIKEYHEVHFIKWGLKENRLLNDVLLFDKAERNTMPMACIMDGKLLYYHINGNDILYKLSNDGGLTWQPRSGPALYSLDNLTLAEIHYTAENEKSFISSANTVPVRFTLSSYNNILTDLFEQSNRAVAEASRSDSLYESINRLQKFLESIDERITRLEKIQHHHSLELEKAKLESKMAARTFAQIQKEE